MKNVEKLAEYGEYHINCRRDLAIAKIQAAREIYDADELNCAVSEYLNYRNMCLECGLEIKQSDEEARKAVGDLEITIRDPRCRGQRVFKGFSQDLIEWYNKLIDAQTQR
jgi:hypothetical protein